MANRSRRLGSATTITPVRSFACVVLSLVLATTACSSSAGESISDDSDVNESSSTSADGDENLSDASESSDGDSPTTAVEPSSEVDGQSDLTDPNFDYASYDYSGSPASSALQGDRSNVKYPPPLVDPSLIQSGGVPPDGIPPIDQPVFAPLDEIDFLSDNEAVVVVTIGEDTRAYPVQILTWHEIVNDEIAGVPVAVTYCPLCNSALAFDRRFGDETLSFGTSGELYQSALVMYDRQTESLWAHFTGRGLVGHYAGAALTFIPAQTVSFAQLKDAFPSASVLTRDTGHSRDYGRNPYFGYDAEDSDPFGGFFQGEIDRTLLAKARIVGIADDRGSVAVRFEDLQASPVIAIDEDNRNLVVFHQEGLASALDADTVDGGRDVGQTGVFEAVDEDGSPLSFENTEAGFVDNETGSTWDIFGRATSGPLEGQTMVSVPHVDTFWFAWATYRNDTTIINP